MVGAKTQKMHSINYATLILIEAKNDIPNNAVDRCVGFLGNRHGKWVSLLNLGCGVEKTR